MILLTHVIIACASILQSTYLLFRPSQTRLKTSYSLVFFTVASGSVLMVLNPKTLTQTCFTGLAYLAVVSIEIFAARRRLSKAS